MERRLKSELRRIQYLLSMKWGIKNMEKMRKNRRKNIKWIPIGRNKKMGWQWENSANGFGMECPLESGSGKKTRVQTFYLLVAWRTTQKMLFFLFQLFHFHLSRCWHSTVTLPLLHHLVWSIWAFLWSQLHLSSYLLFCYFITLILW